MKHILIALGFAFVAHYCHAQTTTQYNLTRGDHYSPASTSQALVLAYNNYRGTTLYDTAGDRLNTGWPWFQWVPIVGQALFCANNVQPVWAVNPDPNIAPNGQVWTVTCQDDTGTVTIAGTFHTTWTIFTYVEGGKGGSRVYYTKHYVLHDSTDDMGNPLPSNVQITQ